MFFSDNFIHYSYIFDFVLPLLLLQHELFINGLVFFGDNCMSFIIDSTYKSQDQIFAVDRISKIYPLTY